MVRMTVAGTRRVAGRLVQSWKPEDATIRYCRYPGPPCQDARDASRIETATINAIVRLEVARGTNVKLGALFGSILGAAIGSGVDNSLVSLCRWGESADCEHHKVRISVIGALFGLGLGVVIGDASKRWRLVR